MKEICQFLLGSLFGRFDTNLWAHRMDSQCFCITFFVPDFKGEATAFFPFFGNYGSRDHLAIEGAFSLFGTFLGVMCITMSRGLYCLFCNFWFRAFWPFAAFSAMIMFTFSHFLNSCAFQLLVVSLWIISLSAISLLPIFWVVSRPIITRMATAMSGNYGSRDHPT